MLRIRRDFPTLSEAERFREGIEFVNDSACRVIDIEEPAEPGGDYIVVIEDDDADSDSENE